MGKLFSKSSSDKSVSRRQHLYEVKTMQGMAKDQGALFLQYPAVHAEPVTCVACIQPDECMTASKDKTSVLFDISNGKLLDKWNVHEKDLTKVVSCPKSKSFFTASRDTVIHMLMQGSPQPVATFQGHELVINGLDISPDGKRLCSGSRDNTVRVWDIDTAQCLFKNKTSRNLVTHVRWCPSNDIIIQSSEDKEVRLYDSNTLNVIRAFPKKQYIQTSCDASSDGYYCLSSSNGFGGNGCEATLWDIRTGKLLHEYHGHNETCCCAVFLPAHYGAGRQLIATTSNDCTVRVWDRDTKECLCLLNLDGSGPITAVAYNDLDTRLCVSTFNMGVQVLDLKSTGDRQIALSRLAAF